MERGITKPGDNTSPLGPDAERTIRYVAQPWNKLEIPTLADTEGDSMKIALEQLRKCCVSALTANGLSPDEAELVAEEYLDAELRGRHSHGIVALVSLINKGLQKAKEEELVVKSGSVYALLNGKRNLAAIVLKRQLPKAIKNAREHGVYVLAIFNMHSYLMPGTVARAIAAEELIALLCNYGGQKRVAPHGSIDPLFATNPLAAGIPSHQGPVVLDMATSVVAMGEVREALRSGVLLPEGIAMDKDGLPTQDPQQVSAGALFPFGGYKGSGIAFVVEVLTSCLLDLQASKDEIRRGYLLFFLDPSRFLPLNKFKDNVDQLREQIKVSRKAPGVKEIFLPGERSEQIKQINLARGWLELDPSVLAALNG